ncbi:MAG: UTP--glucose-1-phosphate uridylyltransferase, partial [Caldilineaceae bacterium]|nr:UTP--glucose-1-phosphate uridylyltransferase [Caldilineaceae bacterium]
GETGMIPEASIEPLAMESLADVTVSDEDAAKAIRTTAVVKLNGGLGTSMGMDRAKSLLCVRSGLSFLDIIARQTLHLRERYDAPLPLIFMNSFRTSADTMDALARYEDLPVPGLPLEFLQSKEPKLLTKDLTPVSWPKDPDLEWCPPGHGDIYTALVASGMLDDLLAHGYEYAFVSNADNLGAVLDVAILGFVAGQCIPFLMEVADRTAADRKGGHLARSSDGRLILRESAQCPPDEEAAFQDIQLYRYFNINNLWINLRVLAEILAERSGVLGLPLIRNEKPVDPAKPSTPRVFQLETAMGAALAVIDGAHALRVPRSRFVPVKKNSDLLVLMSDAYDLREDFGLQLAADRAGAPPVVTLDDRYYLLYDAMTARFPHGAPSLRRCDALTVKGDVVFGRDIVVEGRVVVENDGDGALRLADGSRLRA